MFLATTLDFLFAWSSRVDRRALKGGCGKRRSKGRWCSWDKSKAVSCVYAGSPVGQSQSCSSDPLPVACFETETWWPDVAVTQRNGLASDFSDCYQLHQPGWLAFPHTLFFNGYRHKWKMTLCEKYSGQMRKDVSIWQNGTERLASTRPGRS